MRVALFVPCFVDQFAPDVGVACGRVLRRLGHEIVVPADQTCCGQPALNAGHLDEARRLARRFLRIFEATSPDAVVAPSGSCVAALRVHGPAHLGLDPTRLECLYEFSEFLVDRLGVTDVGATFPGRVTWHDACHPLRELGLRDAPRRLLEHVGGLELVEMERAEECCGFGGTFATKMPGISTAIGARKVRAVEATGASWVASTEASCLFQIDGLLRQRGSAVRGIHLARLLETTT